MDLQHVHPTQVHVVRACPHDDAVDLLAVAGDHTVQVILINENSCRPLASFHIGTRITALAWSSKTTSPTSSDQWVIELAAAAADFSLHLLTKSFDASEYAFPFGGGLSGHHGKINDMTFCGGRGEDGARYVATASDDKMLMVWDLHPTLNIPSSGPSPDSDAMSPAPRPQPTAYVIPFAYPLTAICCHPSSSKEFLVTDCRGSIFVTDWRSDPDDYSSNSLRHSNLLELIEPQALSHNYAGGAAHWTGSAAWRSDTPDIIGAVYGPRYSIWDVTNLRGGKPTASGICFPEGGQHFRWCQTYPDFFAISTGSPNKGAIIHVHNTNYVNAPPTVFTIQPRPHFVKDLDFMSMRGIPRIAAAVGRTIYIFYIGVES